MAIVSACLLAAPVPAPAHGLSSVSQSPPLGLGATACPDLAALVAAAPPHATVAVPACEYRTELVLDRPVTLVAEEGATILGSDIWTAWEGRRSVDQVPPFLATGECLAPGCDRPERVFLDGVMLQRVDSAPGPGQFALDEQRHVVLGDDPAGSEVEVVTRTEWVRVLASDVTMEGFTMRHAANAAQTGAVTVGEGVERFTIRDCDLGHASGANISFGIANASLVEGCDIHDAGQLGIHLGGDGTNGRANVVRRSTIRDNNTAGFDPEWESGGLKGTRQHELVLEGNTVHGNEGPGLWCDIGCVGISIVDNDVHDNTHAGIFFEISTGARITGNRVWVNGWGKLDWAWGAGILVSSSSGAEVADNTVAWNAAGISVISQQRDDRPGPATGNIVRDNFVAAEPGRPLMGWYQDWDGPLYEPDAANRGARNRYYVPADETDTPRFEWSGGISDLDRFNATPGEEGAFYLNFAAATQQLAAAGIPIPIITAPSAPPDIRTVPFPVMVALALVALVAAVALLVGVLALLLAVRSRRGGRWRP